MHTIKPFIEFKKERELGDILTDTFNFIRNEFKPFLGTYFKIVGPYLLVMLLAAGVQLYLFGDIFKFEFDTDAPDITASKIFSMVGVGLVTIILTCIVYTLSYSAVLHYMKSYSENEGEVRFDEVKQNAHLDFWKFFGMLLLVGITLFFGFIFCIIPGIYLLVPLSLVFSIMVFQNMGISEAFSESFKLIKDNWWMTFLTLIVVGIIIWAASAVFSVPAVIYTWIKMGIFSMQQDAASIGSSITDPVYVLLNLLSTLAQYLFNVISIVAGVFIYFNLNEKKNFTGTNERIDNLGGNL